MWKRQQNEHDAGRIGGRTNEGRRNHAGRDDCRRRHRGRYEVQRVTCGISRGGDIRARKQRWR